MILLKKEMHNNNSLINNNIYNISLMQGLLIHHTRKPVILCRAIKFKILVRSMHRFYIKLIKPGHAQNILNILKRKTLSTSVQHIVDKKEPSKTLEGDLCVENKQQDVSSKTFDDAFTDNNFISNTNADSSLLSKYQSKNKPENSFTNKDGPNNNSEYMDQASSLVIFFESLLENTPAKYFLNSRGIDRRIIVHKLIYSIKNDPSNNAMLTKKCMVVIVKDIISNNKGVLSGSKKEFFDMMQDEFSMYNTEKCKIESNENTGISVVYEIYTAFKFSTDQTSVNGITLRSENMATRSNEEKEKSRLFTKQINCDLDIEYKTSKGFVQSLMDILIGRNMQFKGNLVMPSNNDKQLAFDEFSALLEKLDRLIVNVKDKALMKELIAHYNRLSRIKTNASLTDEAKIHCFQEELIEGISLIRQVDPTYNPNMFVFPMRNNPLYNEQKEMAQIFAKQIELNGDITYNCPDKKISCLIEKLLPVYLKIQEHRILNILSHMHNNDKKIVALVIRKYAPEFFEQHKLLLEII